jgi:hypothetical protein
VARYVDAIDLPIPLEEAFDYLADFTTTAEWDPGVAEAKGLTPGAVRLGSRFRVSVSFLGRRIPLEYRITEFERGCARAIAEAASGRGFFAESGNSAHRKELHDERRGLACSRRKGRVEGPRGGWREG